METQKIKNEGFTMEDLVKIMVNKESIARFLRDIENNLRIARGYEKDEGDKLLIQANFIEEIIDKMEGLEQWREEYLAQERAKEGKKNEISA